MTQEEVFAAIKAAALAAAPQVDLPPKSLAAVMLATSWGESHWNATIVGDEGTSFGALQLHVGGLDDVAQRHGIDHYDPAASALVVIAEAAAHNAVHDAARTGTVADLLWAVTEQAMRPRDVGASYMTRLPMLRRLCGMDPTMITCAAFG